MRVVFDANIFLSSLIKRGGTADQLVQMWATEDAFTLLISAEILAEIDRVIHYPRLAKYHNLSEEQMEQFVRWLGKQCEWVAPQNRLAVCSDESDNRYIECAVEGGAIYLVTGDKKHLLPIKEYEGVQIITPRTFFEIVRPSDAQ